MRIIGGSCRGRRLRSPGRRFDRNPVRPTSDRAREALFNLLQGAAAGAAVLDLFAGTGALGLEALSRGAATALFVEADPAVSHLLRENIELCGMGEQSRVLVRDCAGNLDFLAPAAPPGGFTLILADPPYGQGLAAASLEYLAALPVPVIAAKALLVLETPQDESLPEQVGAFHLQRDSRRYGEARFHFFVKEGAT